MGRTLNPVARRNRANVLSGKRGSPKPALDALDATTGWTPTGCTLSQNTSWKTTGTASLKLTGTAANTNADITKALSIDAASFESISFDVYVESANMPTTAGHYVLVSLGFSGFTNYFGSTADGWVQQLGPRQVIRLRVPKSAFVANGTAAWSGTITNVFIRFGALADVTTVLSIDNIVVNEPELRPAGFIVGADDNHDDQWWLYEQCLSRGIPLTLYLVKDYRNGAGQLTDAQLAEMYENGVTFCNHSVTHFDPLVTPATYAEILAEYQECEEWLRDSGYTRGLGFGAPPRGTFTEDVLAAWEELGMLSMRCVRFGSSSWYNEGRAADFLRPNMTPDGTVGGTAETFEEFKPYLDQVIAARAVGEITGHYFIDDTPTVGTECQKDVMIAILDYLVDERDAGRVVFITPPMLYNTKRSNSYG